MDVITVYSTATCYSEFLRQVDLFNDFIYIASYSLSIILYWCLHELFYFIWILVVSCTETALIVYMINFTWWTIVFS